MASPLLDTGPRLALVWLDGVKHDFVGILRVVPLVSLGPVVGDGVGEDGTVLVELGGGDATADIRVALETVLRVLVPEVERAVRPGRGEGAVDGVEGYVVDGIDVGYGSLGRVAVALEGEIRAERRRLAACGRA